MSLVEVKDHLDTQRPVYLYKCVDLLELGIGSVTRLGDLLHFGQLFKACGINYFAQNAHIFRQFL